LSISGVTKTIEVCLSVCLSVWLDVSSYLPFSVEPEGGVVAAGKTVQITVKFSPLDVADYEAQLLCT